MVGLSHRLPSFWMPTPLPHLKKRRYRMARPNSRAIRISGGLALRSGPLRPSSRPPCRPARSNPTSTCRKNYSVRHRNPYNRMILRYNGIWHKYGPQNSNSMPFKLCCQIPSKMFSLLTMTSTICPSVASFSEEKITQYASYWAVKIWTN